MFVTTAIAGGRYQRTPFPGNVLPKSLLSTPGMNLVDMPSASNRDHTERPGAPRYIQVTTPTSKFANDAITHARDKASREKGLATASAVLVELG